MNLLSGLEKFGLDQMDTDHLFDCLLYTSDAADE